MAFSDKQVRWIYSVKRRISMLRDNGTWRLLLKNVGVKYDPELGYSSLKHPHNSQYVFEELMFRLSGLPCSGLNEEHWANQAEASARRLRHLIKEYSRSCIELDLLEPGGLEGFVERMTKARDDLGGCTRDINECDLGQCIPIAQGLIAWMRREADKAGIDRLVFSNKAG